jgi:hypothetical protein
MVDGKAWLVAKSVYAGAVTPEAWKKTVADFSLIWQLFEAKLCDNRARINKLKAIAAGYAARRFRPSLGEAFDYWQDRYISAGNTTWNFEGMFGGHEGKAFVADQLRAGFANNADTLAVLLLIVMRLRGNLFHGAKDIADFNEQKHNLDHGTLVLVTVLDWAKADNPQLF